MRTGDPRGDKAAPVISAGRRRGSAAYLAAVLAGALLYVPLVCAATWLAVSKGLIDTPDLQIYYRQLARIDAASEVDVLLVGDSTLGNTIDARAWREQTGKSVLALPLTGGYGYAGALNMLRRALRHHRPEVVIDMQSLDMATRNVSWEGLLFTAERPSDIRGIPPWRLIEALARVDLLQSAVRTLLAGSAAAARLDGHDYWPQTSREQKLRRLMATRTPELASIRPEKFTYLRQLGALCRAERMICLYAHGPFLDPQCARASAYIEAVNARIEASGLRVVPGTPRCMTIDQAGDAADHVRPGLKEAYSEIYRRLIAAALATEAGNRRLAGYLSDPSTPASGYLAPPRPAPGLGPGA